MRSPSLRPRTRLRVARATAPRWARALRLGVLPAFLVIVACGESEPGAPAVETTAAPAAPAVQTTALPAAALVESTTTIATSPAATSTDHADAPWILEEFDWGDSESIVRESVEFADNFLCFKQNDECRLVRVTVDGEDLIARFQYFEEGLWRVALVTPPLNVHQMAEHGPRVAGVLAGHVARHSGAPVLDERFPKLAGLAPGTHVLARWKTEARVVDVVAVLRDGEKYFVGAYVVDPGRAARAQLAAKDPTDPPERAKVRDRS